MTQQSRKRGGIRQPMPPDADLLDLVRRAGGVSAAWRLAGEPCPIRTWQDRVRRARAREHERQPPPKLPEEQQVTVPPPPEPPAPAPPTDKASTRESLLRVAHEIMHSGSNDSDRLRALDHLAKLTGAGNPDVDESGNFGALEGRLLREVRRHMALVLGATLRERVQADEAFADKVRTLAGDPEELAVLLAGEM